MSGDVLAQMRADHARETAELSAYRVALAQIEQAAETARLALEGGDPADVVLTDLLARIGHAVPRPEQLALTGGTR